MKANFTYPKIYEKLVKSYAEKEYNHYIFSGGRSSAKGTTAYANAILFGKKDIIVYVPSSKTIGLGCFNQFKNTLKRIGFEYESLKSPYQINFNGRNTFFVGIDANNTQKDSTMFKGTETDNGIDTVIFDELATTNDSSIKERIDAIIDTLTRFNPRFQYIFNPPRNRNHWIFDFINEMQTNAFVIHTTIYDIDGFIDNAVYERAESLKIANELEWKHSFLGERVGTSGMAFDINENIWTEMHENYDSFYIQTDEATINATCFALLGLTLDGKIHFITNWFHSSKIDGVKYSPSQYANFFDKWFKELGIIPKNIFTDGIAFAVELQTLGYDSMSINNLKDRALSYYLLNKIYLNGDFKIVNRPENKMLFKQMENATLIYDTHDHPLIDKRKESNNKNEEHTHLLDTALYTCLVLQRLILGGEQWS